MSPQTAIVASDRRGSRMWRSSMCANPNEASASARQRGPAKIPGALAGKLLSQVASVCCSDVVRQAVRQADQPQRPQYTRIKCQLQPKRCSSCAGTIAQSGWRRLLPSERLAAGDRPGLQLADAAQTSSEASHNLQITQTQESLEWKKPHIFSSTMPLA